MPVVDLHVWDSGVESGAATPVVLLHAFPLSARMWAAQHRDLLDGEPSLPHSLRLVTPDLRGLGASPLGADEPSLDRMADDVATLLDRLELGPVVLGGLSMGGYVVMAFMRRHLRSVPARVRAVVLADTKAAADLPDAAANRRRIADILDAESSPRVLVEEVLPKLCGSTTRQQRPDVYDQVRRLVEAVPPAGAAWAQRAMASRPDSYDVLRGVDVPALVVVGDEDQLTPVAEAAAMAAALRRAELVVVEGSGHLSAVEAPRAFNRAVRRFVAAL